MKERKEKESVGIIRDRKNITLLQGDQNSPARPSDESAVNFKTKGDSSS